MKSHELAQKILKYGDAVAMLKLEDRFFTNLAVIDSYYHYNGCIVIDGMDTTEDYDDIKDVTCKELHDLLMKRPNGDVFMTYIDFKSCENKNVIDIECLVNPVIEFDENDDVLYFSATECKPFLE